MSKEEKRFNAEQKASESFSRSVQQLNAASPDDLSIPSVKVSMAIMGDVSESLTNLTNVTCERLQDVEKKLNARQKIDVSISDSVVQGRAGLKSPGLGWALEGQGSVKMKAEP
ncbi:hypothetical protein H0H92_013931 [Tricholoma furcatifolium]|nr:hypothetical protein H0H92_013931 [Tricholoma furcatifolium]